MFARLPAPASALELAAIISYRVCRSLRFPYDRGRKPVTINVPYEERHIGLG